MPLLCGFLSRCGGDDDLAVAQEQFPQLAADFRFFAQPAGGDCVSAVQRCGSVGDAFVGIDELHNLGVDVQRAVLIPQKPRERLEPPLECFIGAVPLLGAVGKIKIFETAAVHRPFQKLPQFGRQHAAPLDRRQDRNLAVGKLQAALEMRMDIADGPLIEPAAHVGPVARQIGWSRALFQCLHQLEEIRQLDFRFLGNLQVGFCRKTRKCFHCKTKKTNEKLFV